jgi:hypothetical protein
MRRGHPPPLSPPARALLPRPPHFTDPPPFDSPVRVPRAPSRRRASPRCPTDRQAFTRRTPLLCPWPPIKRHGPASRHACTPAIATVAPTKLYFVGEPSRGGRVTPAPPRHLTGATPALTPATSGPQVSHLQTLSPSPTNSSRQLGGIRPPASPAVTKNSVVRTEIFVGSVSSENQTTCANYANSGQGRWIDI